MHIHAFIHCYEVNHEDHARKVANKKKKLAEQNSKK